MERVFAQIEYDLTLRGKTEKIKQSCFIDRACIMCELLKLNMGMLKLYDDDGLYPDYEVVFCNNISSIIYIIRGHPIKVDCTPYYGKYFDKKSSKPCNITDRELSDSTLKRIIQRVGVKRRPQRVVNWENNKN